MRNGNKRRKRKMSKELEKVLILPMRNGNPYSALKPFSPFQGSYPTYEEWKLFIFEVSTT